MVFVMVFVMVLDSYSGCMLQCCNASRNACYSEGREKWAKGLPERGSNAHVGTEEAARESNSVE